ncbi:hypothetical protein HYW87_01875 [Candidatus Roizmanbacteria bacterium]|nr:hypothetical protein [Candidatus Roizmanbacteria bacterium]
MTRREVFDAALKSTIPESALLTEANFRIGSRRSPTPIVMNQKENYQAPLESGTTVLAFHFNKGIMLAGDRQTSSWFSIISQESVKVNKIGSHSALMYAGLVSDGQAVVNSLRKVDGDFMSRFGVPLSLDGLANHLRRFVRFHYNWGIFLEAWCIIAGVNMGSTEFKIYSVEPTGCKMTHDFVATGSGQEKADGELERFRGKIKTRALGVKEAVELAVRAIYMAGKKDMGTSDVRLAVPLIAPRKWKKFGIDL